MFCPPLENSILKYTCSKNPEEVGHAFINVRTHVPVTALNYIPHCIPACNLPTEKLRNTD